MQRPAAALDRRPLPRSRAEWRARLRDALHFGERVSPPLPRARDRAHRVVVLSVVAALTSLMLAVVSTPALGLLGRTVDSITTRVVQPLGSVEMPEIAQRSVVLDRRGEVLATLHGEENRVFVPFRSIPKVAQLAVLAIEDAKFYEHKGVDVSGLVRAAVLNFRSGEVKQGGSTITQQLVKNTMVGSERSLDRKIKEARLARRLEKEKTKREIFELYLNEAYFGNGVYGIGTAAEFYFGKKVRKLGLAESALLAGLVKAPENFEPLKNPKAARARRNLVLQRMVDEGFVSAERAAAAARRPVGAKRHALPKAKTPYFVEYVKRQILADERFGPTRPDRIRALFQGGLKISTTLDLTLQKSAQTAVEKVLNARGDPAAALVSIEPKTGAVRAVVGGRNFEGQKFDLATQGLRQPGSTFKTVTLAAALDAGLSPNLILDTPSPITINGFKFHNYSGRGEGLMDMRRATELSVNSYYVQLIKMVGPYRVAQMAKRLGLPRVPEANISLALGAHSVSPLELASIYATLANRGTYCEPFSITKVTTASGKVLFESKPDCERRVSANVAALTTSILRGVPEQGTGRQNGRIGRPVTGKTGTTDNYTNAWYAGYSPQYSTVVWLGFLTGKDGKPCECRPLYNVHGMPRVFGGSLPAMIWSRYMRAAHAGQPVLGFPAAPAPPSETMPDVVGTPLEEATKLLEEAGFTVQAETVEGSEPKGTVTAQEPAAGSSVGKGSFVRLEVSDGSKAPPSPSPEPTASSSPAGKPTSSASPKATKHSPSSSASPSKKSGNDEEQG